jgi:hypothetical protein
MLLLVKKKGRILISFIQGRGQSRTKKVGQVLLRNLAKIELSKPGLL